MLNRQRQALISAYSARNITIMGAGTIDGNGWDWWNNVSFANGTNICSGCKTNAQQEVTCPQSCLVQRPKLIEFVDTTDVVISGASKDSPLTLRNSPFWTLHPIFCKNVQIRFLNVLAPRDHGNTDGIDPDSCNNVHVADCHIEVLGTS